jgi:hypothetical protein
MNLREYSIDRVSYSYVHHNCNKQLRTQQPKMFYDFTKFRCSA